MDADHIEVCGVAIRRNAHSRFWLAYLLIVCISAQDDGRGLVYSAFLDYSKNTGCFAPDTKYEEQMGSERIVAVIRSVLGGLVTWLVTELTDRHRENPGERFQPKAPQCEAFRNRSEGPSVDKGQHGFFRGVFDFFAEDCKRFFCHCALRICRQIVICFKMLYFHICETPFCP